ncbi:glutathione S-transferase [Fluviicoccus keumensis]|uniref:Glutathione S-transferase n=1 Tax=Fluviicoccus keumensis TaxID=1435465 RepID=A0A4Q7ZBE0_9GAMM|nr:glutathione S-transferase family protein [Fluviicoccus keumensis]RZU47932.1 glutathione S-transferase [Fluviicoccus keumensis]
MKLYYTTGSHFARKVRLLLAALETDVELVDAVSTARTEPERFGGNPLLTVPVLVDGQQTVLDSDRIAAWLVQRFDPGDRFRVLTADPDRLNARMVLNGVMAAEVELLLAARSGLSMDSRRWEKKRRVIRHGLLWLETRSDLFAGEPDYLDFHLLACWDHLRTYGHFPDLELPLLSARAARLAALPWAAASAFQP